MFIPPRLPPRPRPRPIPFPRPREPRPRPRLKPAEDRDGIHRLLLSRTQIQQPPEGAPRVGATWAPAHLVLGHPWTGGTGSAPWSTHHSPPLPSAPHFLHTGFPEGEKANVMRGPISPVPNCTLCPHTPFGSCRSTGDSDGQVSDPGPPASAAASWATATAGVGGSNALQGGLCS